MTRSLLRAKSGRAVFTKAVVRKTLTKPQFWFGLAVLGSIFAWYIWFSYGPILRALTMALTDYKLLSPKASEFVGLDNFKKVFDYSLFWIALKNTTLYCVGHLVFQIPLALLIAVAMNSVRRGQKLYRFIIFLPVVISLIAVTLLFRYLMDPQVGLFNQILKALGLGVSKFHTGTRTALASVIGIDIWKGTGFHVVILSAGLLNIPQELYDAATVDGTNAWQRFWRVTLPLLGHTMALEAVVIVVGTLQTFTTPFTLTGGGPNNATLTLNMLVYSEAFQSMQMSFATAIAFTMFLIILVISVIQLKLLRPRWEY